MTTSRSRRLWLAHRFLDGLDLVGDRSHADLEPERDQVTRLRRRGLAAPIQTNSTNDSRAMGAYLSVHAPSAPWNPVARPLMRAVGYL
jgi:hypothetical protein